MQDIFSRLEQACLDLNWTALALPGLIAVAVGLFLWLGGLRYSALVLGVLGAVVGAFLGGFVAPLTGAHPLIPILIGALVLAILATLLQQVVIIFLAIIIAAVACGLTYMSYTVNAENWEQLREQYRAQTGADIPEGASWADIQGEVLSRAVEQSREAAGVSGEAADPDRAPHEQAMDSLREILDQLSVSARSNSLMLTIWVVLGALVGLGLALLLKKAIMAFCCSIVGTASVFLGTLALLFAKDVAMISAMRQKPAVAPLLLGAMVLFGLLVQLLLGRPSAAADKDDKDDKE